MFVPLTKPNRLVDRNRSRVFTTIAIICVVLLAMLAFAQVTHAHPAGTDTDHCALCVVLHSAVPVVMAAAIVHFAAVTFSVPTRKTRPAMRHWHAQLFNRPPPALSIAFFG